MYEDDDVKVNMWGEMSEIRRESTNFNYKIFLQLGGSMK